MFLKLNGVLALVCALLGTMAIGVVRYTNDDHALRTFLMDSPGCEGKSVPCFIGLEPGVTSIHDTLDTLNAQAWVQEVDAADQRWRWNDRRPDLIHPVFQGGYYVREGMLTGVRVHTTIRLGDVWAVYGQPDWSVGWVDEIGRLHYTVGYDEFGVDASLVVSSCGVSFDGHLNTRVTLTFRAEPLPFMHVEDPTLQEITGVCAYP